MCVTLSVAGASRIFPVLGPLLTLSPHVQVRVYPHAQRPLHRSEFPLCSGLLSVVSLLSFLCPQVTSSKLSFYHRDHGCHMLLLGHVSG